MMRKGPWVSGLLSALIQTTLWGTGNCEKVLVWETIGAKSHMMAMDALVRGLAQKNHSVTYVVYYKPKWLAEEPNVEFVHLGIDLSAMINNEIDIFNFNPFNLSFSLEPLLELQHQYLKNPLIKGHVERKTDFDLTIMSTSTNDMGVYLARKVFKTPTILFASGASDIYTASCMGNPFNPSYVSGEMADVGSKMSFFERVQNTLMVPMIFHLMGGLRNDIQETIRSTFNDPDFDLAQHQHAADMFILNQHPLFDKAKPLNPNTVMVGGIHIKKERTKLPKDIQQWLDGAEHGIIYVSLGSVTQGSRMPQEKREAMINAFADLKERVLWKWETEEMPNKLDNVMLKKWCPQQDILAHPKVKMFVTHGGLLSTYESVYFATPMLVLPGFGDQFANAHFVKEFGLGERMRWYEVNHQSFEQKLLSVLHNKAYKDKAQEFSNIFKDEPMDPVDKAVFYAEYVMRHKGAAHLRPSSMDLYWFQYFLVDVFLFFLAIVAVVIYVLKFLFTFLKGLLFGKGTSKKKNKKHE